MKGKSAASDIGRGGKWYPLNRTCGQTAVRGLKGKTITREGGCKTADEVGKKKKGQVP